MQSGNGLDNKRVVVLGGSSGIGFAVAELAASFGADVVIASRSAERVQTAIKSIGGKSDGRTLDVSDERAIHTFFTELGAFDHLVFTAGDSLHLQDLARIIHKSGALKSFFVRANKHATRVRIWLDRDTDSKVLSKVQGRILMRRGTLRLSASPGLVSG